MPKRVLIFVVAYNAERHIVSVLERIPDTVWHNNDYSAEVIVIDDASTDRTTEACRDYIARLGRPIHLFRTPENQGYGGNQKLGYLYAIEHDFTAVVLLHGDAQYAPELLPEMIAPVIDGRADAVFGSRMIEADGAKQGGMPLYKRAGNRILTNIQNAIMRTQLSEYHSGYRCYSVDALRRIPFRYNSNWFDFDTDIIVQLTDNRMRILEIPIATHYGDEICHVNGVRYAWAILKSCLHSRMQKLGIFYDHKFNYAPDDELPYEDKCGFDSSHRYALLQVNSQETVLDIGAAPSHVDVALKAKGCRIYGIDQFPPARPDVFEHFEIADANRLDFDLLPRDPIQCILLLDVIEHVDDPERFMQQLWRYALDHRARLIVTTPNIAFLFVRIMLLLGRFEYGKRGILDRTHKRLFTFKSLRHLMLQSGFRVESQRGIPAPFPLALGNKPLALLLLRLNALAIWFSKSLFAFQIGMVVTPVKDLDTLFRETTQQRYP